MWIFLIFGCGWFFWWGRPHSRYRRGFNEAPLEIAFETEKISEAPGEPSWWLLIVVTVIIMAVATITLILLRRRRRPRTPSEDEGS